MEQNTYVSPELCFLDLEAAGVLCSSSGKTFNSPQDYSPSQGIW